MPKARVNGIDLNYIEAGSGEGRVCAQAELPARAARGGFFVRPTLLSDLPAGSRLLREEVFGPVLTVEAVRDVASACDVVDGLRFGLTGGLFNFTTNLAGIITPIVIGATLEATGGSFFGPLAYIAVVAIVGALAYSVVIGDIHRLDIAME